MLENRSRVEKGEQIYCVSYVLLIIAATMEISRFVESDSYVLSRFFLVVVCALLGISCLGFTVKILWFSTFDRLRACGIVAVLLLLLASAFYAHNVEILVFALPFFAADHVRARKILPVLVAVSAACVIAVVGMSQMGLMKDLVNSKRHRHFLGYKWTTNGPILYLFIMLQYLFLRGTRFSLPEYLLAMGINIWFYIKTDTNMTFWLLTAALTFFILFRSPLRWGRLAKRLKLLFILAPELIALLSIGLHYYYDAENENWVSLNKLMHSRLSLGYAAIQEYGFTLFGTPITWVGGLVKTGYNYVDCSYLQLQLTYGTIFLLLVLLAYSIGIKAAFDHENYVLCWIMMFVLLFGVTEPWLIDPTRHPFVMFAMYEMENPPIWLVKEDALPGCLDRFRRYIFAEVRQQPGHTQTGT